MDRNSRQRSCGGKSSGKQYASGPPYEIVCFHCQQAAEKYLKWFLVFHDREPPKIHDLEELEKLCETISPAFSTLLDKCSYLTVYGVLSRYPSGMQVEKEDMDRALEYAEMIRDFIRAQVPGQEEK
jgi:HEPN domain-containing protein